MYLCESVCDMSILFLCHYKMVLIFIILRLFSLIQHSFQNRIFLFFCLLQTKKAALFVTVSGNKVHLFSFIMYISSGQQIRIQYFTENSIILLQFILMILNIHYWQSKGVLVYPTHIHLTASKKICETQTQFLSLAA